MEGRSTLRSLRRQPEPHQDAPIVDHADPTGPGGRHARHSRRKWFFALIPVAAILAFLGANVANGSTQRPIVYKVASPITVQALGVDLAQAKTNETVTAGAKLVAERRTNVRYLVIAVRDQAGNIFDFPRSENVTIGTAQQEYTAKRSFSKPGTYTISVAYMGNDGVWKNLGVKQTFVVGAARGGGTPSPAPTTSSPSPKPSQSTAAKPPSGPSNGAFPNASNTGVPDGVELSKYTGSCSITTNGTVIDSKIVNCDLSIKATDVVIKRSRINGEINGGEGTRSSFRVEDSEVINGARAACQCIGSDNFTVLRTEIKGGNRGIYCRLNCTVEDSWIHGTALLATQHASAIRVEQHSTITHNTMQCDWTALTDSEIGCSADMTGYPDFAPITHNTISNNLFMANPSGTGYCAYGGATGKKEFSGDPTNATYIKFINNVWQKGSDGKCGTYGPITGFDKNRTGNEWTGNKFDDGTVIGPEL
jgi:hypothetical protein